MDVEIPGFELTRPLGAGGFGSVWLARQPSVDRDVAVKIGHQPLADERDRIRFERECRALGRLSGNPHIVVVHVTGTLDDGRPYLVMEYVGGGTLADLAKRRALSAAEIGRLGSEVCRGLADAHDQTILHRDIKPANVLLRSDGSAVLGDFGIAVLRGNSATFTASGAITATVPFAAPEVLSGSPATIASDLYSVGATMLATAMRATPFVESADTGFPAILNRVLSSPPPDIRLLGYPAELAEVLERLMAKDPDRRPATATTAGALFRAIADGGHTQLPTAPSANATQAIHSSTVGDGGGSPDPISGRNEPAGAQPATAAGSAAAGVGAPDSSGWAAPLASGPGPTDQPPTWSPASDPRVGPGPGDAGQPPTHHTPNPQPHPGQGPVHHTPNPQAFPGQPPIHHTPNPQHYPVQTPNPVANYHPGQPPVHHTPNPQHFQTPNPVANPYAQPGPVQSTPQKKGAPWGLIGAGVAALVVVLGVAGWFVLGRGDDDPTGNDVAAVDETTTDATTGADSGNGGASSGDDGSTTLPDSTTTSETTTTTASTTTALVLGPIGLPLTGTDAGLAPSIDEQILPIQASIGLCDSTLGTQGLQEEIGSLYNAFVANDQLLQTAIRFDSPENAEAYLVDYQASLTCTEWDSVTVDGVQGYTVRPIQIDPVTTFGDETLAYDANLTFENGFSVTQRTYVVRVVDRILAVSFISDETPKLNQVPDLMGLMLDRLGYPR